MPRAQDLPCADCGKLMVRYNWSLPVGRARCQPCRNLAQPPKPRVHCRDCGARVQSALPQGEARCRACRKIVAPKRLRVHCVSCGEWIGYAKGTETKPSRCHPCRRLHPTMHQHICVQCGQPFERRDTKTHKYCSRACLSQAMQIRPPDDQRVRRIHREQAAPGLNPGQRYKLRDKRIAQGHKCAYCQAQADTIDHVVPLVRGGTNYEGNLVVCCRSCNSSKSGSTIMEWRTGRRLPRMTTAVVWPNRPVRQPKAKPAPIEHNCPICGTPTTRAKYCTTDCADEALARYIRDRYRTKAGLPPQPRKPTNTERSQRIQQREHLLG